MAEPPTGIDPLPDGGPASPFPDEPLMPLASRAELGGRSARSGFAQLASQATQLVLLVASGMALARLLTPTDFGLVAMVAVVSGILESVRHFGLTQAAVHHDDLSAGQATTLFWRAAGLSLLAAAAFAATAPLLAALYDEPRVIVVTLVFAASYVIRGLTAVHEALLMRRLRFGRIVAAELGALLAATATGLTLALLGAGYLALLAQTLVLSSVYTAAIWALAAWRPGPWQPPRERADVGALFAYGSNLTRFQIMTYVGRNVDRALVGVTSGAQALGFYDAAYRWSLYPVKQIHQPLSGVALASLSRVRNHPEAYRRACRVGLLPIFSVILPALVLLSVEAERAILTLLGDQWGPAVPLFRVLCIGAIGSSVIKVTRWLFMAQGDTARQLRWGMLFLPVMVVAVVMGLPWGSLGVAAGFTVGSWIMVPSAVHTCLRDSALRPRDFYAIVARPALAALFAAALPILVDRVWPAPYGGLAGTLALVRNALIYGAGFAAIWIAMPGGLQRLAEVWTMLRQGLPSRLQARASVPR